MRESVRLLTHMLAHVHAAVIIITCAGYMVEWAESGNGYWRARMDSPAMALIVAISFTNSMLLHLSSYECSSRPLPFKSMGQASAMEPAIFA